MPSKDRFKSDSSDREKFRAKSVERIKPKFKPTKILYTDKKWKNYYNVTTKTKNARNHFL